MGREGLSEAGREGMAPHHRKNEGMPLDVHLCYRGRRVFFGVLKTGVTERTQEPHPPAMGRVLVHPDPAGCRPN
jgi:hypothetical protein